MIKLLNLSVFASQVNLVVGKNCIGKTAMLNEVQAATKTPCAFITDFGVEYPVGLFDAMSEDDLQELNVGICSVIHTPIHLELTGEVSDGIDFMDLSDNGASFDELPISIQRVSKIILLLRYLPKGSTLLIDNIDYGLNAATFKPLLTNLRVITESKNITIWFTSHNAQLMKQCGCVFSDSPKFTMVELTTDLEGERKVAHYNSSTIKQYITRTFQ